MSNFLAEVIYGPILIRPKRNIAGLSATVTLEEIANDDLEITQHPVQRGADITDNAYKKPSMLVIRALWSDQLMPLAEIYEQLLTTQATLLPFDVVTGKRTYSNMMFLGLGQTTDPLTENCLSITATLKEIILVDVEVATIAPRAQQAMPEKTAATENAGTKSPQLFDTSVLKNVKSGFTSILGAPSL